MNRILIDRSKFLCVWLWMSVQLLIKFVQIYTFSPQSPTFIQFIFKKVINSLVCTGVICWNAAFWSCGMQVGGYLLLTPKIQLSHDMRTMICAYVLFACLVYSYALPSHPMLIMQPSCYLKAALSKECKEGKPVRKRLLTFCFGHEHLHFFYECFSVWKKITYFATT